MATITDRDLAFQVEQSLPPRGLAEREGIDVEGIVEAIKETYGLVSIDTIDDGEYWAIVRAYTNTSQQ